MTTLIAIVTGWFLYIYWPRTKTQEARSEVKRIRRKLKEGLTILEIAQSCKHHNQDDILAIKHEMWNNGWENY